MPVLSLPDGSQRRYDRAVTVVEVAADIGPGLARAALAGRVNGELVDTSYLIENDAELVIVTAKDADGLEILRHSTAHLLALSGRPATNACSGTGANSKRSCGMRMISPVARTGSDPSNPPTASENAIGRT